LKAAAKGGHVELVRYLHKQGSNVSADSFLNKQDDAEPHSLLYYAVSGRNADIVEDLIRWGAEVDQEDWLISRAVLAIIENEGDARMLDVLFGAGVKDTSSGSLASLLPYVITDHFVDTEDVKLFDAVHVVDQLIKNGADLKNYEKHGRRLNLLMELLGGESYNRYLDEPGEENKAYGRWLQQFIEFSAHRFIQGGVAVKEQDVHGQTALHDSASNCYPKVTSMLLQAGANPEVADKIGEKPLDKVLHVQQYLSKPHRVKAVQYAKACQQTLKLLQ
jgi:ankyrin repeat protein